MACSSDLPQSHPLLEDASARPARRQAWRRETRVELLRARDALPAEAHRSRSDRILETLDVLFATFGSMQGVLVGVYWPIRREVDVTAFVQRLVAQGAAAALPVVVGKGQPLQFRRWQPGDPLEKGTYGIPQPLATPAALAGHPPATPAVEPAVLLIPLVGFDAACFRLGYGGGFYDRTLGTFRKKPLTIGIGFELARLETIYPRPCDVAMDYIVTEAGVTTRKSPDSQT